MNHGKTGEREIKRRERERVEKESRERERERERERSEREIEIERREREREEIPRVLKPSIEEESTNNSNWLIPMKKMPH